MSRTVCNGAVQRLNISQWFICYRMVGLSQQTRRLTSNRRASLQLEHGGEQNPQPDRVGLTHD
jgi:hypothetical protein